MRWLHIRRVVLIDTGVREAYKARLGRGLPYTRGRPQAVVPARVSAGGGLERAHGYEPALYYCWFHLPPYRRVDLDSTSALYPSVVRIVAGWLVRSSGRRVTAT